MYICCKHCEYTGNFLHEKGHSCKKHKTFIDLNSKESVDLMFNCKDCQLYIHDLIKIARHMKSISFEYILNENFRSRNDMGIIIKDEKKFNKGFYKDSIDKVFKAYDVDTTEHIIGWKILFNEFPVYYTESIDEIKFIKSALGFEEF